VPTAAQSSAASAAIGSKASIAAAFIVFAIMVFLKICAMVNHPLVEKFGFADNRTG
jgi:hypothetical protein